MTQITVSYCTCCSKARQCLAVLTNAGQLGLGSSGPGHISTAWSRIKPTFSMLVGMCLLKKEFVQQKLEEGCLLLRNIFMRLTVLYVMLVCIY